MRLGKRSLTWPAERRVKPIWPGALRASCLPWPRDRCGCKANYFDLSVS